MADHLTIIVPTIGKSPYLEEALESILKSAPGNSEVLLFLNGCPQLFVQKKYSSDPRLKVHSCLSRLPPTESWNTAVGLATGRHILFIGDDDRLDEGFAAWWGNRKEYADFIIMGIRLINSVGNVLPIKKNEGGRINPKDGGLSLYTSQIKCYLGGVIFLKDAFNLVGGFKDLKMSNAWFLDTYLWSRLISKSKNPIIDNMATWCYRINQHQMGYKSDMPRFVKELDAALDVIVGTIVESTDGTKRELRRHLIYARTLSNIRNGAKHTRKIDFAIALGVTARYCGIGDAFIIFRERLLQKSKSA